MFKKLIEESTGKSPWLFHINAGSCNGCDIELVSVLTPRYDAERLGFKLTGHPAPCRYRRGDRACHKAVPAARAERDLSGPRAALHSHDGLMPAVGQRL